LKAVHARVVVVSGNGKHFCSGLDCKIGFGFDVKFLIVNDAMTNILTDDESETDPARKGLKLLHVIEVRKRQESS